MKHVEFVRDLIPWRAGERRLFPNEIAQKLVADGCARVIGDFPDHRTVAMQPEPRPVPARRSYRTKGA